jgi:SAM-dependent methyltransferase
MIICQNCRATNFNLESACQKCGFSPNKVAGFFSFAPNLAHGGGGFKSTYFSELARLEDANFWFFSRNQLILWALKEYSQDFNSLLEIGCGTGYVLSGVAKQFPRATLYGSEIFTAGLNFAATRLPSVSLMQMDARDIPFEDEFDVIGAFDVLEHIKEDELVLAQVHAALKPLGCILITVPQHSWLWSPTDEYACHVRRYSALDIHKKIESAGFNIIRSTSFISTLLPVMMVSRFFQKNVSDREFNAATELKIPPLLNKLFLKMLRAELAIIKKGFSLPLGGSRLVVARKAK